MRNIFRRFHINHEGEGQDMQKVHIQRLCSSVVFLLAVIVFGGTGFAKSYVALDGVEDVKVIFDVRGKKLKALTIQLDLIHQTFYDESIRKITKKPEFAVVFGGAAVRYISEDRDDYTEEEKLLLEMVNGKLTEMNRDGIRLEVCLFAADVHDVDPATIPDYIHRVDNGWISTLGYQAQGYSLVAVF